MTFVQRYAPHLLYILPALAFVAAGSAKLAGVPDLHASFAQMGLPVAFGYFIGLAEVAGAAGLLWSRTRVLAAAGLVVIMLGAIYYHVAYGVPSPIPAIILLGLLAGTIFVYRPDRGLAA